MNKLVGMFILFSSSASWAATTKITLLAQNQWGFKKVQSVLVENTKVYVNAVPITSRNTTKAKQIITQLKPLPKTPVGGCPSGSYIFEVQENGKTRKGESCSMGQEFAAKIAAFEELKKLTIK